MTLRGKKVHEPGRMIIRAIFVHICLHTYSKDFKKNKKTIDVVNPSDFVRGVRGEGGLHGIRDENSDSGIMYDIGQLLRPYPLCLYLGHLSTRACSQWSTSWDRLWAEEWVSPSDHEQLAIYLETLGIIDKYILPPVCHDQPSKQDLSLIKPLSPKVELPPQ